MAKRLERISGCRLARHGDSLWVAVNENGEIEACVSGVRDASRAEQQLVEAVYRNRCNRVLANYGYRCARCGKLGALEVHHKKHRSKGRDDRMENLIPLCNACHRREHGET